MTQAPFPVVILAGAGAALVKLRTAERSSCGRGITWTLTTSPIRLAAAAPASTAAFTAATSPATNAVTRPLPILSQPTSSTLAAFNIASLASTSATNPLHSIMPSASSVAAAIMALLSRMRGRDSVYRDIGNSRILIIVGRRSGAFSGPEERDVGRVGQVATVGLVGVDVHFEL